MDWESFVSKRAENGAAGLRLVDMETFPSNCDANCLNHVLMPDDPSTPGRDSYDYGITAASALDVPLRGRNTLLQAAGFAAAYRLDPQLDEVGLVHTNEGDASRCEDRA